MAGAFLSISLVVQVGRDQAANGEGFELSFSRRRSDLAPQGWEEEEEEENQKQSGQCRVWGSLMPLFELMKGGCQ